MSRMHQLALLSAGCQPWNSNVCDASGERFAYCATLAIYIYQFDTRYNEFKLHSIMSEHKKTITAIAWHPQDGDLILSASADNIVIVWNVPEHCIVGRIEKVKAPPVDVAWCPSDVSLVSFACGRGPVYTWNYLDRTATVNTYKDAHGFHSNICQFRWHPTTAGKLVVGHTNGSISLFCAGKKTHKHVLRPDDIEDDENDPIVDMSWDPLSVDYLLIANDDYGIRMVDSNQVITIMRFSLPSKASSVHTLDWIPNASGMFVTGDTNVGILRVWNVSQQTPIENMKLKKTGFHALHVFSTNTTSNSVDSNKAPACSSTSLSSPKQVTSRTQFPAVHAVCTFQDGGVGLYNLAKRKWDFLRDEGHIETIFDCKFSPEDPDILATASFDGTIKCWDVSSMKAVNTSPGNEGIIYTISWAPANLNCIAAASSKNGAFIWDIGKGKIVKRFHEHGKYSVFSVAWSVKDSRRIASCGADGYCVVRQVDGQLLQKYKHPAPVFGCDWSMDNKDMLATGCEDHNVRVYYLATNSDKPLRIFSGHKGKVFHVKWCPLKEGILCSGSDDGTIRIWDYTQDSCKSILSGHTEPVRGLQWNTEVPYLLLSGSWDYSIRVWDVRDGACIDTVLDHGADVYGITSHPARPFIVASCSRDSTVRLWTMNSLVQPLEMNIVAGRPWSDIIASPEQAMSQGTSPLLTGRESKELKLQLDDFTGNTYHKKLKMFSQFFMHPVGTNNLWNLVSVVLGTDDAMLPESYKKGIVHTKHIMKYRLSEAQTLELSRTSHLGRGVHSRTREDSLQEAAHIHIKLGNIERYCELMVELGHWEKALAVSPGVSMEYWKNLTIRYSEYLKESDSDQLVPYLVSTGSTEALVAYFISHGRLYDAQCIAQVAVEGVLDQAHLQADAMKLQNGFCDNDTTPAEDASRLLQSCSDELADWHFRNGCPVLAACCHLAVGECKKALSKLIRGNELELAVSVGLVLNNTPDLVHIAAEFLAMRCEKIGHGDLAIEMIKSIGGGSEALVRLCARSGGSMAEIDDLHMKSDLSSLEECLKEAEKLKNQSDVYKCVKFYMISTEPERGIELGLKFIKDKLCGDEWNLDDVYQMIKLLGCVRTDILQQHTSAKNKANLLILSAYLGAMVAVRRCYVSIVVSLFNNARYIMGREENDVPVTDKRIMLMVDAYQAHHLPEKSKGNPISDEQRLLYKEMLKKAGTEIWPVEVGSDCVFGSHLPSHSDVHTSFLTSQRIQGPAYFLEDGKTAVALNDALMWAKVNPFSPLASGERINPF